MEPTISVVTVTRNALPLLRRTFASVSEQTCQDMEYIIVDGASTDGSTDFIAGERCVSRWVSERDGGIYDAMNKGARMASGRWIIFMNAGDTFAGPDVAAQLAQAVAANPEADVIYGDTVREGIVRPADDRCRGHGLAFCHQSVICRRELLTAKPFDTAHKYSADFKFFKQLHREGRKFVHVPFAVACFDTSGISSRKRSEGLADNMRVIAQVDGLSGIGSLLHLFPTYIISRLRGK